MSWIKAFHIIAMVTWFSGLFYLPRLFVYHATVEDTISNERFKVMERKLYYYITTPGAIITIILGFWLMAFAFHAFINKTWLDVKLLLVALLTIYHVYLGKLLHQFKNNNNKHSHKFFRYLNEVPTIFLIAIVILAEVKPF